MTIEDDYFMENEDRKIEGDFCNIDHMYFRETIKEVRG